MIEPLSHASTPLHTTTQSKPAGHTISAPSHFAVPTQSIVHWLSWHPPVHSDGHAPPGATGALAQADVETQRPASHNAASAGHAFPQAPQFAGSLVVFTQPPAHAINPGEQLATHAPDSQSAAVPVHAFAHPPQFVGSDAMSTQSPLHDVEPIAHSDAVDFELPHATRTSIKTRLRMIRSIALT